MLHVLSLLRLFDRVIMYNSITERITADLLLVNFHYRDCARPDRFLSL